MRNLVCSLFILSLASLGTPALGAVPIVIDSTVLHFEADNSGPLPVSSTFNFSMNSGSGTFHTWSVSDDAEWLDESPSSGSQSGPLSRDITISVNTTGLAPATYTGVITVTSTGVSNSPQTVEVTYVVNPKSIPTLSEWGMIIFGLLLLGWMTRVFSKRKQLPLAT